MKMYDYLSFTVLKNKFVRKIATSTGLPKYQYTPAHITVLCTTNHLSIAETKHKIE